jgi:hypothetical protein
VGFNEARRRARRFVGIVRIALYVGKLVVYVLLDIAMFGTFRISRKEACYSRLTFVPA